MNFTDKIPEKYYRIGPRFRPSRKRRRKMLRQYNNWRKAEFQKFEVKSVRIEERYGIPFTITETEGGSIFEVSYGVSLNKLNGMIISSE